MRKPKTNIKSKKANLPGSTIPDLQPALPTASAPAPASTEGVDDSLVRKQSANQEIRAILNKYNCVLVVTSLNIQTGRILPQVEVIAK